MLDSIIESGSNGIDLTTVLICSGVSIVLGFIMAIVYKYTERGSKHFLVSLSILPIVVQTIIMLVNGNLGMSVAIAGAFSLVRFRSIAGTSKEIVAVFLAMVVGVATGMGYVLFASLITVLVLLVWIILVKTKIFESSSEKMLKVTIPENLDYSNVFDDIFEKYLERQELVEVKTTNMGSLFDLKYKVILKSNIDEKKFIDEIRVRNANLKIILSHEIDSERL